MPDRFDAPQINGTDAFDAPQNLAFSGLILSASGTLAGTSSMTGNPSILGLAIITGTTPEAPENQGTAIITGQDFGASQGTGRVEYPVGVSLIVNSWSSTSINVDWPNLFVENSPYRFNVLRTLRVFRDDGSQSNAFQVATSPRSDHDFYVIQTNDTGYAGYHDLDLDIEVGVDEHYGYGGMIPDPQVQAFDTGHINNVPDLYAYSRGIYDVSLGRWSNIVVEQFSFGVLLNASGTMPGTSSLVSSERLIQSVSGVLTGTSAMTGAGQVVKPASGALSGTSFMTGDARADTNLRTSGTLAGSSAATAANRAIYTVSGTMAGTSAMVGRTGGDQKATGTLSGTSAMSGSGRVIKRASGTLTGSSVMSGDAEVKTVLAVSGTMVGTSTFAGATRVVGHATGVMNGTSGLTGPPRMILRAAGTFSGGASMTGDAGIPSQTVGPIDRPGFESKPRSKGVESSQIW